MSYNQENIYSKKNKYNLSSRHTGARERKSRNCNFVSKMPEKETAPTITEDEAALYDRQIRLWGLDAQRRLIQVD